MEEPKLIHKLELLVVEGYKIVDETFCETYPSERIDIVNYLLHFEKGLMKILEKEIPGEAD